MTAVALSGVVVPQPIAADFAALSEVRRLASAVNERFPALTVLVNNAATQPPRRRLSHDGYELGLAVNYLAHFLLTSLLLEQLRDGGGRVVTTSSSSHKGGTFDFSDLQMEKRWAARRSYGRSKLANILFAAELNRRSGIPSSSFHPGSVYTDLNREAALARLTRPFERLFYATPERGADTLVWLATSREGGDPSAVYYVNRAQVAPSRAAQDTELAAQLWDTSERLVGVDATR
jgi:NAD(P)-dependent dehydrogenase (short-subunit alcohol dehydrogenase family)